MKHRRKEIPTCEYCWNVEDLLAMGAVRLCQNCRTCAHGHVFYSLHPDAVCLQCVRDMFTDYTFVGPRIADISEYIAWARRHGFHPESLLVWTFEEQEWLFEDLLDEQVELEIIDVRALLGKTKFFTP